MALYNRDNSRIVLRELKMLSPDVLALVKKNKENGLLEDASYDWNTWIEDRQRAIAQKAWYERNVINILNLQ
mgnify:CR=1 FL=1